MVYMQKKKENNRPSHVKSADAVRHWFKRRFSSPNDTASAAYAPLSESALFDVWGKVAGDAWKSRTSSLTYGSGRLTVYLFPCPLGALGQTKKKPALWVRQMKMYLPDVRTIAFREVV